MCGQIRIEVIIMGESPKDGHCGFLIFMEECLPEAVERHVNY